MREDQEEQERGSNFATPFSATAAEDAKRFNLASGPVAKPVVSLTTPEIPAAKPEPIRKVEAKVEPAPVLAAVATVVATPEPPKVEPVATTPEPSLRVRRSGPSFQREPSCRKHSPLTAPRTRKRS